MNDLMEELTEVLRRDENGPKIKKVQELKHFNNRLSIKKRLEDSKRHKKAVDQKVTEYNN